jgi:peptidoglycan/LPS O-acetylase OafA/YrhL
MVAKEDSTKTVPEHRTARRCWIDRLRLAVIAGVIVVHTCTAYVVNTPWYYQERTTSTVTPAVLNPPVQLIAAYGLSPLFLVAGLLSASSLARRGPGGFAKARMIRLGVPAMVYLLLVDPFIRWWGADSAGESVSLGGNLFDPAGSRGFGPLWFAVALLGFSVIYAGWRHLRPVAVRDDETVRTAALFVIAAGIALADLVTWRMLPENPDLFWDFNWPHWQQAAGVFVLGVLAGERGWFRALPSALARACGWVAIMAVSGLVGSAALEHTAGREWAASAGGLWQSAVVAVLDGTSAVALSVWLVDRLQKRWNGATSTAVSRAAGGSYAAYLLHPVVLVGLSVLLRPSPWPPEVKLLIVAVVGVPLCFWLGYLASRIPGVDRVL